jgi:hypothetical protein
LRSLLSQTQNEEIESTSVEGANAPLPPLDATQTTPLVNSENNDGKVQVPEGGQSILNRQDVLDIAKNNQVKKKRSLSLMNAHVGGWEDGHEDLSEILQGYTSPGRDTFRIHRDLIPLLIMSSAAEMPNRAALQAKQDAYDQVTLQAQIELGKQIAKYEEQRRRMAVEHERCLEALKLENQRMMDEAVRVRNEYANAFMAAKTPTAEEIEIAQSRHHHQILKEQMAKKVKRLKDESA